MKRATTPPRRTALAVDRLAFCGVISPRLGDKAKPCPSPGDEITTPYPGVVHSPYEGEPAVLQRRNASLRYFNSKGACLHIRVRRNQRRSNVPSTPGPP